MPFPRPNHGSARTTRGVLLAVLGVVLTACGSAAPATTTLSAVGAAAGPADVTGQVCCAAAAPAGGVVGGVSTAHNGWDIAFVNFMALHDAVAAEMGDLAPARARSPQVKEVAAAVSDAQGRRFQRMSAMATAWGEPVPPTDPAAAGTLHDHGGGSADATYANAAALAPLSGTAFDRQFLTAMIAHHRSAMPVAQATLDSGENPQARELTRELVAEQSAELATMQHLLGSL